MTEKLEKNQSVVDSEKNWWLPTNLIEDEENFRKIDDINLLDTGNDFGSYRRVFLTNDINASQLELHNDLSPISKIHLLSKVIKITAPSSILDAGCGMGFTTQAISETYPGASVLGVDISKDAIEFATKTHKKVNFKSLAISPEGEDLGNFDVIFCFEFYPFTRNNNIEVQSSFINYFSKQLKFNGKIIIYQKWNNLLSLSAILQDVKKICPNMNFKIIKIPHHKIYKYFPSLTISKFICFFLEKITNKELIKNILIVTKNI